MSTPPSIINEVVVTYNEFIKVLTQLGYRNESDETKYRFVNDKHNSIVDLPLMPFEATVRKVDLAVYSYRLYMQGIIKQEENLIKKIQQNRAKKTMKT